MAKRDGDASVDLERFYHVTKKRLLDARKLHTDKPDVGTRVGTRVNIPF